MVAAILSSLVLSAPREVIPVQYMPASQNPFERTQTVIPASDKDQFGLYFFNDQDTSDKALQMADQYAKGMTLVQVSRMESNGAVSSWDGHGHPIIDAVPLLPENTQGMQPGEEGIVFELPTPTPYPASPTDKIQVNFGVDASRRTTTVRNQRRFMQFVRIGSPTSKFSNIKLSVRSTRFVGTISKEPNSTTKVEDVTYKIQGPMLNQTDGKEHLEIIQSGQPFLGQFSIAAVVDWDAFTRDLGKPKTKGGGGVKVIRNGNEAIDYDNMHLDLYSPAPVKYWSSIAVLQGMSIRGYLSHIATQPN